MRQVGHYPLLLLSVFRGRKSLVISPFPLRFAVRENRQPARIED